MRQYFTIALLISLFFLSDPSKIYAQELEPRTLTNLPRGLNFVAVGYAYASGNTLLDPTLPLEDFNGSINTIILAYGKSVNFFGASGKVDVVLPFAGGDFTGVYQGEGFTDSYTGFGDLRVRASVNLTGAPSLEPNEFKNYSQKTVSGLGVQIIIPTGNYKKEQLPNLGSNRWTVRVNYGISHTINMWVMEARAGVWLFGQNNNFLGDNEREQAPLWVLKGNIIKKIGTKGMWLAFSTGYGYGAQTSINNIKQDITISQMRLGLTCSLPLDQKNTLKFTAGSGIRFLQGSDFDVFGVTYSRIWLSKKRKEILKDDSAE
jgi:hypothetical protein